MGRKRVIPLVRQCVICGADYTSTQRAVRTCGRACGNILQWQNKRNHRYRMPTSEDERMERIKLLVWLERAKAKGRGAKVDIDFDQLVSAWQAINKIPLKVVG